MRFECKRCGKCCSPNWLGGGGVINFSPEDQRRAAAHLRISVDDLRRKYVNGNDSIDLTRGACTFLEKNHCIIDEVKPHCCRLWPWTGRNKTVEGQRESAKRCPGIVVEE